MQKVCTCISNTNRTRVDKENRRNTDVGETHGNRIGVMKGLVMDLLRRHESYKWNLTEGVLPPNYCKDK